MRELLTASSLVAGYDELVVVDEVTLAVGVGETVAIIGPNGAGKTALLNALAGLSAIMSGAVRLAGIDVTARAAFERARLGLAYVPSSRHLFGSMSVRENLQMGAYGRRGDTATLDMVYALFPRLAERTRQRVATMSGGEQQMVAVGRALMSQPRLLVLDEPSSGLAPALIEELYAAIAQLAHAGVGVLVAEQHVDRVLAAASRGYVLDRGQVRHTADAATLRTHPQIRRTYLGWA